METTLQTLTISRNELVDVLSTVNNPTFVSMITRTRVDLNKYIDYWLVNPETGKKTKNPNSISLKDRGINEVWKTSTKYRIITGFDYVNSVNGRLEREGKERDFEGGGECWYDLLSKGLVIDKGTRTKHYFRYQYLPESTTSVKYTKDDGDPIQKQQFQDFMVEKDNSYSNQGLDDPCRIQVCKLENILEISVGGFHYILTD